jgi:large subunit ribosomal protein L18
LTGELAARRAVEKGIKEAILDIGLKPSTKGSKLFATLKGLADAGLQVPHSPELLPPMDRIRGVHISGYAKKLAGEPETYKKRFSAYAKRGLKPEDLAAHFDQVKESILKGPVETERVEAKAAA